MYKFAASGLIFVTCVCLSCATAGELVVKVRNNGDDHSVNCRAEELVQRAVNVSLRRAIDLVSCGNWAQMTKDRLTDVRIELDAGVYRLDSTLEMAAWGSKSSQGKLTITGPTGGGAVLSGARELKGFQPIHNASILARLPASARGQVFQAELKSAGLVNPRPSIERGFGRPPTPVTTELFFGGQAMKVAAWPNTGWGRIHIQQDTENNTNRFGIEGRDVSSLSGEPDMVASGYFNYGWAEESIPVISINQAKNQIMLSSPGPRFGIKDGARVRIENALSELDQPGEWYLDRAAGLVYFWPPQPLLDRAVELSVVDTLISVKDSRNVHFSRLQFNMARGNAVTVYNGDNVVIEQSIFRNAGNRALVVAGGKDNGLTGSEIEDVGEGGVTLRGGDRNSLQPGNLFVTQSRIRRFSRLSRTYRPAVEIDGVGNKVVGNIISDAPHSAIIFRGNDHQIAFNNISRVVQDVDDAGAIYTGRDWTARGTVIEGNFFHDIGRPGSKSQLMGIYLDDQSSGIVVRGNIFARVQQPVFIGGGRNNIVENNLFFHSAPAIHLDDRGLTWQRTKTIDHAWDLQKKLNTVPYNKPPYSIRYPNLANILDDDIGAPKYNVSRQNVVIDSEPFQIPKEAKAGILIEGNFHETDDVFLKPISPDLRMRPADFVLKDPSMLLKSGFQLPELEKMAN